MARAIEAVAGHGLRRIVYHSVLRPGLEAMPHHWDKLRAEERLAESHLDTVTLQPCSYMQNIEPLLDTVRETGLYQPLGGLDAAISFVDLADVGERWRSAPASTTTCSVVPTNSPARSRSPPATWRRSSHRPWPGRLRQGK